MLLAIKNGRIITEDAILEGSNILIKEGTITGIYDETPGNTEVIDAEGNFVFPGLLICISTAQADMM